MFNHHPEILMFGSPNTALLEIGFFISFFLAFGPLLVFLLEFSLVYLVAFSSLSVVLPKDFIKPFFKVISYFDHFLFHVMLPVFIWFTAGGVNKYKN